MAFLFAMNRMNRKLNSLHRNIRFRVDIGNEGAIIQCIDSKHLKNRFEINKVFKIVNGKVEEANS